jgi:hypothetical protein
MEWNELHIEAPKATFNRRLEAQFPAVNSLSKFRSAPLNSADVVGSSQSVLRNVKLKTALVKVTFIFKNFTR